MQLPLQRLRRRTRRDFDYIRQTEFRDVSHTVVRDGRVVAQISARQVRNFPPHGRTILIEVQNVEYDASGRQSHWQSLGRATG